MTRVEVSARFTPENEALAREIIARYPRPKSATIPLCHLAQEQDGHLTDEAMAQVAELVGCTSAEVMGTASFYEMFKMHGGGPLLRERVHQHLLSAPRRRGAPGARREDARHPLRWHDRRRTVHARGRRVHRGLHRGSGAPGELPLLPPRRPRPVRRARRRPPCRFARRRGPAARHARTGPSGPRGRSDRQHHSSRGADDARCGSPVPRPRPRPRRGATRHDRLAGSERTGVVIRGPAGRLVAVRRPRRPHPRGLPLVGVLPRLRIDPDGARPVARRGRLADQGRDAARTGRRRLPRGHQVELLPSRGLAPLHRGERRRVRARHLQGPRAHGARSPPADRRLPDRGLRHRRGPGVPVRPGRDAPRPGADRRRAERGVRGQPRRPEHPRHRLQRRHRPAPGAPARTSSARRPA